MYDDGAPECVIVYALLQSLELQAIAVFAEVSVFCKIETQAGLVRRQLIRKLLRKLLSGVPAM